MDYEFRIQVAEKELAHLREMHSLMRSHIDTHDASFEAAIKRFDRIEANLENVSAMQKTLSTAQLDELQHRSFFGLELKPLTYLLGSMNMILHGVEGANLELANTLEVHSQNVAERDKYQVILANPPYYAQNAIAERFIRGSRPLLAPGGRFFLVTKQPDLLGPLVADVFGPTEPVERRGYVVLCA